MVVTVQLTDVDINNLLGALNLVSVQGENNMKGILILAQKLRDALIVPPTPPLPPDLPPS